MKAKTIKALDAIIAGLEELKEALELEASKSGSGADDADTGKVSSARKPAKSAGVPAKGKGSRPAPDDDDDLDEADADADDSDDEDDEDDAPPPPKAAVKGRTKAAAAPAAKKAKPTATKGKAVTIDAVKEKLTEVMTEASLGKAAVLKILKKHGASKSSELDEDDYAAVIKACDAALATVEESDDDEGDDE